MTAFGALDLLTVGSGPDWFFANRLGGGTFNFPLDFGPTEALDDLLWVPSE